MNESSKVPNTSASHMPMLTSSFKDRTSADKAYADLRERGYEEKDIHMMMTDETREKFYGKDVKLEHGNKAMSGAGVGGAVGVAVGATVVGLLAAAAAVTVPVLGLVIVGPLAGAIAGAAGGAAAGGLVGLMVGAGIPEDRAKIYESEMKAGSIVVGVTPRNDQDAIYFEKDWRTTGQHVYR